jgi:hypothetical protein
VSHEDSPIRIAQVQEDLHVLLLFAAIALTNAQQAHHDRTDLAMYQRLQADKEAIADMWGPEW